MGNFWKAKLWHLFHSGCSKWYFQQPKFEKTMFLSEIFLVWFTGSEGRRTGKREMFWICNKDLLEVQSPP